MSPDLHPEELLDRARREALAPAEQAVLDAHLAACVVCRFERQAMADFADAPATALDVDGLVTRALTAQVSEAPVAPRRRRGFGVAVGVAAALLSMGSLAAVGQLTGALPRLVEAVSRATSPAGARRALPRPASERATPQAPASSAAEPAPGAAGSTSSPFGPVRSAGTSSTAAPARGAATSSSLTSAPAPGAGAARASAKWPSTPPPQARESAAPQSADRAGAMASRRPGAPGGEVAVDDVGAPAPAVEPSAPVAEGGPGEETPDIPAARAPTAPELFAEATAARRRGARGQAIVSYQRLLLTHPRSDEAGPTRAMLGRLLLEAGRPAMALEALDAYLSSPEATMREDVLHARGRALARLGRPAAEADAWRALLEEFPDSVYARGARARLAALSP